MFYRLSKYLGKAVFRGSHFRLEDRTSRLA